jgi:predicted nucleic acid-binding protein
VIVLDSSAAVDYLLGLRHGEWVADRLLAAGEAHAPHLIDLEVVAALRRLVAHRAVSAALAERALGDHFDLRLVRYPHLPFVERMWELRSNVAAGDAAFVALAESLGADLVTLDRALASAPGLRASILTP